MENSNPLITICIPLYGERIGLQQLLTEILKQTYPSIEIIVSDDATKGLTETTLIEELNDFISDIRFTVRANIENMGTVAHFNLMASMAKGEYIKFMTIGDHFLTDNELYEYQKFSESQCNPPIVFARANIVSKEGKVETRPTLKMVDLLNSKMSKKMYITLAKNNMIASVTAFYHKDFFVKHKGFDESYRYLEDWPTWLKFAREECPTPCLNRITVEYIRGGISNEGGDIYNTPKLLPDMLRCYKNEIFLNTRNAPYKDRLSIFYLYIILITQGEKLWLKLLNKTLRLPLKILKCIYRPQK